MPFTDIAGIGAADNGGGTPAISVASPGKRQFFERSLNRRSIRGPQPSLSYPGGRIGSPIVSAPPPDYPSLNVGSGVSGQDVTSNPDQALVSASGMRPVGTQETNRTSRPSLFGDLGTDLGDVASGLTYVREGADPILAFGQGFAGERASRNYRLNANRQAQIAGEDRAYSRQKDAETASREDQRLALEKERTDYETSGKAAKSKLVGQDGKTLSSDGWAQVYHLTNQYGQMLYGRISPNLSGSQRKQAEAEADAAIAKYQRGVTQSIITGKDPTEEGAPQIDSPQVDTSPQSMGQLQKYWHPDGADAAGADAKPAVRPPPGVDGEGSSEAPFKIQGKTPEERSRLFQSVAKGMKSGQTMYFTDESGQLRRYVAP